MFLFGSIIIVFLLLGFGSGIILMKRLHHGDYIMFFQREVQRMKDDELQKKREEAERKARRGEIDPTHEFTFLLIGQVIDSQHMSSPSYSLVR